MLSFLLNLNLGSWKLLGRHPPKKEANTEESVEQRNGNRESKCYKHHLKK
jgi:hypothetical protein